jgi:hypothetical protein
MAELLIALAHTGTGDIAGSGEKGGFTRKQVSS